MIVILKESIFTTPQKNDSAIKELLKMKSVKEFINLSKKLIIDKQKLSKEETIKLKELMNDKYVKKYINACKRRNMFDISAFWSGKLLSFLSSAILVLFSGGVISPEIVPVIATSNFIALTSAFSSGYFKNKPERKKVESELKKIGKKIK